jgi:hypothetical protein
MTYLSMNWSTACSSAGGCDDCGSSLSQGRGLLDLMLKASSRVRADGSWCGLEKEDDRRDVELAPTELLRFLGECEESCELDGDTPWVARKCSITFSVSWRKMRADSSLYPSQTSLRLIQRRQDGRPSSQRTRRCRQRIHPRLRRPM